MSATGRMFQDRQEKIEQDFVDTEDEQAFRRDVTELGLGDDWIDGTLDAIKAELRKREKEMNTTDNNETTASMPPKVASAVSAVMSAVPKLAKTSKNSHGNYNFASIDDFLEAIRPLCAKNGLIISQDEEHFELRDGWLFMRFAFTLAHSSGEVWGHQDRRSIMVSSKMGAQAFGAAQSYALKQYMRSLFQVATGEKGIDADEHPSADLPTHTTGGMTKMHDRTVKDGRQKTSSQAKKDGDSELFNMVAQCEASLDLTALLEEQRQAIEAMPANWQNIFNEKFDERMADLNSYRP